MTRGFHSLQVLGHQRQAIASNVAIGIRDARAKVVISLQV